MYSDPPLAHRLLEKHFGFSSFRPGQEHLVADAMSGRDALGVLPTGGGKSLCYQVPALALPGLTLVLIPLISLMEDQTTRAVAAEIPAGYLKSALSGDERRAVLLRAVDGALRLLFVAPERLETVGFSDALDSMCVSPGMGSLSRSKGWTVRAGSPISTRRFALDGGKSCCCGGDGPSPRDRP